MHFIPSISAILATVLLASRALAAPAPDTPRHTELKRAEGLAAIANSTSVVEVATESAATTLIVYGGSDAGTALLPTASRLTANAAATSKSGTRLSSEAPAASSTGAAIGTKSEISLAAIVGLGSLAVIGGGIGAGLV